MGRRHYTGQIRGRQITEKTGARGLRGSPREHPRRELRIARAPLAPVPIRESGQEIRPAYAKHAAEPGERLDGGRL